MGKTYRKGTWLSRTFFKKRYGSSYELEETVNTPVVDSLQWIGKHQEYLDMKVEWSRSAMEQGYLLHIIYRHVGEGGANWQGNDKVMDWVFFILPTEMLMYNIALIQLNSVDITNISAYSHGQAGYTELNGIYSEQIYDVALDARFSNINAIVDNGGFVNYRGRIEAFFSQDFAMYHAMGWSACVHVAAYDQAAILSHLRNTWYDKRDMNLKPFPDYVSPLEIDNSQPEEYIWRGGMYMAYWGTLGFYVPNLLEVDINISTICLNLKPLWFDRTLVVLKFIGLNKLLEYAGHLLNIVIPGGSIEGYVNFITSKRYLFPLKGNTAFGRSEELVEPNSIDDIKQWCIKRFNLQFDYFDNWESDLDAMLQLIERKNKTVDEQTFHQATEWL